MTWPVHRGLRWLLALTASSMITALTLQGQGSAVLGLDHIPVAVRDLERAAATYRALGFSLKPGRPHPNGIRNVHVKFPDGSGVELLTVPKGVDDLSAHYTKLLAAGEGPAFLSFHERDTGRLHAALRRGGHEVRENNGITKTGAPDLSWIFMVSDNRSPTDRPEHFAHPNGAMAMRAVWLAPDNPESVVRLLVDLGGRQERRRVTAPATVEATVVRLAAGEVVVLPRKHQVLPGRPVLGASFIVRDLAHVRQMLAAARITPLVEDADPGRIVIEPAAAHGLWLEFVQVH